MAKYVLTMTIEVLDEDNTEETQAELEDAAVEAVLCTGAFSVDHIIKCTEPSR